MPEDVVLDENENGGANGTSLQSRVASKAGQRQASTSEKDRGNLLR